MKKTALFLLPGLLVLGACETWERPYVDNSAACDEIVDSRARLDCYAAAEQAEEDWREEKKRDAEKTEAS